MGRYLTLAIALPLLLAGCESWPKAPEILVSTAPPGASCVVARLGQPLAVAAPTPAIALVPPDPNPLTVACQRSGFAETAVVVPAQPASGVGAAATYPSRVDIAMAPLP